MQTHSTMCQRASDHFSRTSEFLSLRDAQMNATQWFSPGCGRNSNIFAIVECLTMTISSFDAILSETDI